MSLNPVYLWNLQNFPDPQAMLPDGFDAAHFSNSFHTDFRSG